MIPSRTVALVAALVAVLGAVTGTGGFSTAAADRGLRVSVADDDSAYLGFEQDAVATNGTTNLTVTITNQFGSSHTLSTVEVTVDDETEDLAPLGPGEAGRASFEAVDCDGLISVEASGDGVSVSLDRDECG